MASCGFGKLLDIVTYACPGTKLDQLVAVFVLVEVLVRVETAVELEKLELVSGNMF